MGILCKSKVKIFLFPLAFQAETSSLCKCFYLAHTLSTTKKDIFKFKKDSKLLFHINLLYITSVWCLIWICFMPAARRVMLDSEVLTVQPLSPSANRCVGKAQTSSRSFGSSINNLFVLIHQVCGCRNRYLCSMWGLSISWMSAVS